MQLRGERRPFLYEIYLSPRYRGVECALWPALYFRTCLRESVLEGQNNRASGKISYMHKVLSPVVDFSINYDILQYQYDRWLFKTITGAVNASKASGCSPSCSLENKSFSKTFWQHQNLFLIDAVHQYGFPSLFITISPYEWTFTFPPFIKDIRNTYGKDTTQVAVLETLHIAHVLEQLVRGYLTGGNSNRWRTHVLSNVQQPSSKNVKTFFYRCEFQQRGTVHLHMLVWLEDVSSIRVDVMHASVPWQNAYDVFLVANTQKSHKSCLPVNNVADAFITDANRKSTLEFHYTEDDAQRNIRAYITTLLGSLKCRTDMQLADGSQIRQLVRHKNARISNIRRPLLQGCYRLPGSPLLPANSDTPRAGNGLPTFKHQSLLDRQDDHSLSPSISRSDDNPQGVQHVPSTSLRRRRPIPPAVAQMPSNVHLETKAIS